LRPLPETLTIAVGDTECSIVPALGGAIAGWRVAGQEMLRRWAGTAADPLTTACFPLVPYAGRIANGQFEFDGRYFWLPNTLPGEAHPIHGVGFQSEWRISMQGDGIAVIALDHPGNGAWPYPFRAEQHFAVEEGRLRIGLRVVNRWHESAPLAIALHPYFQVNGAELVFAAERLWPTGGDGLPEKAVAIPPTHDFAQGRAIGPISIDDAYDGWDGRALIGWHDRPLAVYVEASANLPFVQLYVPAGEGYFCFEPMPHLPDALTPRLGAPPMPSLACGEEWHAEVILSAVPRD
jgi:aldose 1-epimerase